jgi:hypothetical protein
LCFSTSFSSVPPDHSQCNGGVSISPSLNYRATNNVLAEYNGVERSPSAVQQVFKYFFVTFKLFQQRVENGHLTLSVVLSTGIAPSIRWPYNVFEKQQRYIVLTIQLRFKKYIAVTHNL